MKPMIPAAITISGKGTLKKKIPIKANAASTSIGRLFSARLPTRCTACNTIASTAAFRPRNKAVTTGMLP
jgi:hypothetical protein